MVEIYLILGFLFAVAFQLKGLRSIDSDSTGASFGFRILLIPGSVLLWPVLLKKWIKATR